MKKIGATIICTIAVALFAWSQVKKPQQKGQQKKVQTTKTVVKTTTKPTPMVGGKAVYSKVCITCHQKDGGGVPRLNPPLIKTDYVLGDKTRLIRIVLKGLSTPLEIEDEQYTNPMPAQPALTDQQIADVLTYVRSNFGNKASAITPAEVKAVRASTK